MKACYLFIYFSLALNSFCLYGLPCCFFVSPCDIYWLSTWITPVRERPSCVTASFISSREYRKSKRTSQVNNYRAVWLFSIHKAIVTRVGFSVRPPTILMPENKLSKECREFAMCCKKSWEMAEVVLETYTGLNPCDSIWHHFEHRMKRNILKRQPLAQHPARLMWLRLSIKSRKPAPNAIMHIYWA